MNWRKFFLDFALLLIYSGAHCESWVLTVIAHEEETGLCFYHGIASFESGRQKY